MRVRALTVRGDDHQLTERAQADLSEPRTSVIVNAKSDGKTHALPNFIYGKNSKRCFHVLSTVRLSSSRPRQIFTTVP